MRDFRPFESMSKIRKFISCQWHDIKGNAKWSLVQWVAISMIPFITGIIRFIQHAPLWQVGLAVIATCVCVYFLFSTIRKILQKSRVIQAEEKEQISSLQIDSIICEKESNDKSRCRVIIKNHTPKNNSPKQARDLKVELVKINPLPTIPDSPNETLPIAFPLRLNPKEPDGNIINPNGSGIFELFSVSDEWAKIEVEFLTDAHYKTFVFERLLQCLKDADKDEKSFGEYHLTISAEADCFPRIEETFKMTIADNRENPIMFSNA